MPNGKRSPRGGSPVEENERRSPDDNRHQEQARKDEESRRQREDEQRAEIARREDESRRQRENEQRAEDARREDESRRQRESDNNRKQNGSPTRIDDIIRPKPTPQPYIDPMPRPPPQPHIDPMPKPSVFINTNLPMNQPPSK